MLTRIRIEVEEETAEACVEALWKYEHAIVQQEVRRYRDLWPVTGSHEHVNTAEEEYPTFDHPWSDTIENRDWYNSTLGRELTEENIAYDESGPGFRGRRVVRFVRVDTRHSLFMESLTMESVRAGLGEPPPIPTTRVPE
jgi:hypothetical protein